MRVCDTLKAMKEMSRIAQADRDSAFAMIGQAHYLTVTLRRFAKTNDGLDLSKIKSLLYEIDQAFLTHCGLIESASMEPHERVLRYTSWLQECIRYGGEDLLEQELSSFLD